VKADATCFYGWPLHGERSGDGGEQEQNHYVILVHIYQNTKLHPKTQERLRKPAMDESVLVSGGRELVRKPIAEWQAAVRRAAGAMRQRLSFMTAEHYAVRNFVVIGLQRLQRPLPVAEIAARVKLPVSRAQEIVEELERRLFFLVRNPVGDVAWAFPVTVDRTPHEMECDTGERVFGACAEDAFGAAFALGRLRRRRLRVEIRSRCGQSGRLLALTVTSDLASSTQTKGTQPLLFVPSVDWEGFQAPNIIDDY
jgi:hypothetical protein